MLHKAKTLESYRVDSLDGHIGNVNDFYFDDHHWAVRYLVAATGSWLEGRKVLLSPYARVAVSTEKQHIAIALTKRQIEDSPSLASDKPVSRQFEESYYAYYGWPMYWNGPFMWGGGPYPVGDFNQYTRSPQAEKVWDPHLRSTRAVSGYHIQAADGEIGHVEDFVIDDQSWAIRYLIINTHNWWPGKKVLVAPYWIERISWETSKIFAKLSREAIKQSPQYTEESGLTREYEAELHHHYKSPGYWVDEPVVKAHSR
jgi:hypothetical protein